MRFGFRASPSYTERANSKRNHRRYTSDRSGQNEDATDARIDGTHVSDVIRKRKRRSECRIDFCGGHAAAAAALPSP